MGDPDTTAARDASRVCVVGSLNMDFVVRAPRIALPGETVLGGAYRTYAGGKGANQAVAAKRMGAAVSLLGCIGDDPHGIKVRQVLESEGLDLSHIHIRAGEATGLALITVSDAGENTIVVSPGANATLTPDNIRSASAILSGADVVLMQLETPNAAVAAAASIAHEAGRVVMLNAAPARALPAEVMKLVDVLIVNRTEAARLLGMDANADPARLALRMPDLGPSTVILTQGPQGAILNHRGRPRRIPSHEVRAIDTTGAGDAFCGALAALWPTNTPARSTEEFRGVERAVIAAVIAGALATTRPGAIPSLPTLAEVLTIAETIKIIAS